MTTEKALLLLGEHAQGVPVQVNMQVNVAEMHRQFNEMVEAANARVTSDNRALPNDSLPLTQEHRLNTACLVHLPAVPEWSDLDDRRGKALCVSPR